MKVKVVPGDTLWTLAEKHLGSGTKWIDIWQANQTEIMSEHTRKITKFLELFVNAQDLIFPDMELEIPEDKEK